MVHIYLQKQTPFNSQNYVGIAITGSESQRHTGIFYNTGSGEENRFLHLAFHFDLRRDQISDQYCWISLDGFESEERLQLAVWFDSIWKCNKDNVPYGINYSNSKHFNNTGAWTASSDDGGLTCATFVLAIFEDFGFPLIDIATSYCRESDAIWHKTILCHLKKHATKEYIDKQSEFLGQAARYRPEEVVGAAWLYKGNPIQFVEAVETGEKVLERMRVLNSLTR